MKTARRRKLPAYSFPGGTILPGFIDVHAHLTGDEDAGSFANGQLFGDQLIGAVYQVGLLLDAGFTGIRDMSEAGFYLSRGVEGGAIRGPPYRPRRKRCWASPPAMSTWGPQMTKEYINAHDHLSMPLRRAGRLCPGGAGAVPDGRQIHQDLRHRRRLLPDRPGGRRPVLTGGAAGRLSARPSGTTPMSPPTALAMKGLTRRCWRGSSASSTGSCSPSGRST